MSDRGMAEVESYSQLNPLDKAGPKGSRSGRDAGGGRMRPKTSNHRRRIGAGGGGVCDIFSCHLLTLDLFFCKKYQLYSRHRKSGIKII